MREKIGLYHKPFHDCVMVHPNYVGQFHELVSEIYKSYGLYNMSDNLFFDRILGHVIAYTRDIINNRRKSFGENSDIFSSELIKAVPEHIYEKGG